MARAMPILSLTLTALLLAAQASADAAPPGKLGTLPPGVYQCALPGDAADRAFVVVADKEFRIATGSTYSDARGTGTYILRGRELTFTRGSRKGEQYYRVGQNQLRAREGDGSLGELLCTRLPGR